jgi:CRISPR-associated protein Cmr4
MKDFRVGYLYSLAPIHCGGEGDLGNISEIAREVHTNFPYIPGSSLRGSLRNEVESYQDKSVANRLFGYELTEGKGVHQIWFGDARLLWVPMRTMSVKGEDVFTWVSCPTLLRDCALISRRSFDGFVGLTSAVGSRKDTYMVADARVEVEVMSEEQKRSIKLTENWSSSLGDDTKSHWENNRIILPDNDFQVLMEHSLWTQVRNVIADTGGAEMFWTDVCIPRDTIFYYAWGYSVAKNDPIRSTDCEVMTEILTGLIQVGGQANVGRGWVQSWVGNDKSPIVNTDTAVKTAAGDAKSAGLDAPSWSENTTETHRYAD